MSSRDAGADVVGANCGNGIETMLEIARRMRSATDVPLLIHSNAGIPAIRQGQIVYPETPDFMAPRFEGDGRHRRQHLRRLLRNDPRVTSTPPPRR